MSDILKDISTCMDGYLLIDNISAQRSLYQKIQGYFEKYLSEENIPYTWTKKIVCEGINNWEFDDPIDVYFASAVVCKYLSRGKENDDVTADAALYLVDYIKEPSEADKHLHYYVSAGEKVKGRFGDMVEELGLDLDIDKGEWYPMLFLSLMECLDPEIKGEYLERYRESRGFSGFSDNKTIKEIEKSLKRGL